MKRFLIILSISIVALGLLFWFILYSPLLANNFLTIQLKEIYQNAVWKVEGIYKKQERRYPPYMPLYTLRPQPSLTKYTYVFFGYYKDIDYTTKIITLSGLDKKTYTFEVPQREFGRNIALQRARELGTEGIGLIEIIWDDSRTLPAILKESGEGSVPLNKGIPNLYISTDLSRPPLPAN